jgi:hypothetical protein
MATLPNGKTIILPQRTYAAGTHNSPAESLSSTQSSITIEATRVNWPNPGALVVIASATISYDGGATFVGLAGFTTTGGNVIDDNTGATATSSYVTIGLPQVGNANRQVMTTVTLQVALTTEVSITVN